MAVKKECRKCGCKLKEDECLINKNDKKDIICFDCYEKYLTRNINKSFNDHWKNKKPVKRSWRKN